MSNDFDDALAGLENAEPPTRVVKQPRKKVSEPRGKERDYRGIAKQMREAKKIRIVLEEHEGIPPSGQFVGINGYGYKIIPGEEVDVPEPIVKILDNCVFDRPVFDSNKRVIGYRKSSRLPYRVIREDVKSTSKRLNKV